MELRWQCGRVLASCVWAQCWCFYGLMGSKQRDWRVPGAWWPQKSCRPGELGWLDGPGPQASPLPPFPATKPSGQWQAHWTKGRQAGRQGGEPSGTGRKESIVCRNPTKGPGPQCGGFFGGKTDMPFFPPTAAKTAHWI